MNFSSLNVSSSKLPYFGVSLCTPHPHNYSAALCFLLSANPTYIFDPTKRNNLKHHQSNGEGMGLAEESVVDDGAKP